MKLSLQCREEWRRGGENRIYLLARGFSEADINKWVGDRPWVVALSPLTKMVYGISCEKPVTQMETGKSVGGVG